MSTRLEAGIPGLLKQAPDFKAKSRLEVETWYLAEKDLATQEK